MNAQEVAKDLKICQSGEIFSNLVTLTLTIDS